MNIEAKLQEAATAIQKGDNRGAGHLLREILKIEPKSEIAWLLMSAVVESKEDKQKCLLNILKLNPDNAQALIELAKVNSQLTTFSTLTQGSVKVQKWEYLILEFTRGESSGLLMVTEDYQATRQIFLIAEYLNELGEKGWEIVSFIKQGDLQTYLCKRPKS